MAALTSTSLSPQDQLYIQQLSNSPNGQARTAAALAPAAGEGGSVENQMVRAIAYWQNIQTTVNTAVANAKVGGASNYDGWGAGLGQYLSPIADAISHLQARLATWRGQTSTYSGDRSL